MSEAKREPIYCICCGTHVMGYKQNGRVVWFDKRHGEKHVAQVELDSTSELCKPTKVEN